MALGINNSVQMSTGKSQSQTTYSTRAQREIDELTQYLNKLKAKQETEAATVEISEEGRAKFDIGSAIMGEPSEVSDKYGYESELDAVSSDFATPFKRFIIGRTAGTGIDYKNIDYSIIDKLNAKYDEMKKSITDNYSGETAEKRLSALDKAFENVYQKNIIKPVQAQIDSVAQFNSEEYLEFVAWANKNTTSIADSNKQFSSRMSKVQNDVAQLKNAGIGQYLNAESTRKWLQRIVSSFIDVAGTSGQKAEYHSLYSAQ